MFKKLFRKGSWAKQALPEELLSTAEMNKRCRAQVYQTTMYFEAYKTGYKTVKSFTAGVVAPFVDLVSIGLGSQVVEFGEFEAIPYQVRKVIYQTVVTDAVKSRQAEGRGPRSKRELQEWLLWLPEYGLADCEQLEWLVEVEILNLVD